MAALALIGGIYGLVILIGLPWLIVQTVKLRNRVEQLEKFAKGGQAVPVADEGDASISEAATAAEKPGPWETQSEPEEPEAPSESEAPGPADAPPKRRRSGGAIGAGLRWAMQNWILSVAGVSLVLAGVYLIQYGVENGLLTPTMRVIGAVILGLALIAGGEVLRRRYGDVATESVRYLPSTLSGAGITVLFIAVLAAHALYDLIGTLPTLIGMILVSAAAILMGWLYGPLLSALGLIGGGLAPFMVSGGPDGAEIFHPYYAALAISGLAIDAWKRWGWVSYLALTIAMCGQALLWLGLEETLWLLPSCLLIAAGALTLPQRSLVPTHDGQPLVMLLFGKGWPERSVMLAQYGVALASGAGLWAAAWGPGVADNTAGFTMLLLLGLVAMAAAQRRRALADYAVFPVLGWVGAIALASLETAPIYDGFIVVLEPESRPPLTVHWLLAGTGLLAFMAHFTANRQTKTAPVRASAWAGVSAVLAAGVVFLLEFLWAPANVLGAYGWAIPAMVAAALMVQFAAMRARLGGATAAMDTGLYATAAFSLIGLSLFVLLSDAALTAGLSLLIVMMVELDRRYRLPPIPLAVEIAIVVVGIRLFIDPGLDWALNFATPLEFLTSYLAPIAAMVVMLMRAAPDRHVLRVMGEGFLITTTLVFLGLALARQLGLDSVVSHWGAGLGAAATLVAAVSQMRREANSSGLAVWMRRGFALFFGLSFVWLTLGLFVELVQLLEGAAMVGGPPVFDTLALALLPLTLVALALAVWLERNAEKVGLFAPKTLAGLFFGMSALAYLTWGSLEIRRLWRGPDLSVPMTADAELYSYTVFFLVSAAALLGLAIQRRSHLLRRIALVGFGLVIAKVFFVDISGLSGLLRVASLLGLGLALVALTWVDRALSFEDKSSQEPDKDDQR